MDDAHKERDIDRAKLRKGLNARHLSMISIGGVIGVGMFLGSSATVKLAGPSVVIAYAVGGLLMMFVMFALAEMSVAQPAPGSFRLYASQQLGPYAGFVTGWMYWLTWVVIMAAEVVAAATYTRLWFGPSASFMLGTVFAVLMTWVNLQDVRSFGEFEFWFALIKVIAIVAFIGLGLALIFGAGGLPALGATNYTGQGGFLPNGLRGLALSMALVMVAYGGTEVIGVAAAETRDPARNVPIAVNGVIVRTLVLYVGSIAVLVGVLPWHQAGVSGSPFVLVLNRLGIPAAGHIMNVVVITAALSAMNSGLYTSARMLYSLAKDGMCSPAFAEVDPVTRVPQRCVLASAAGLYAGVLAYYIAPAAAFLAITSIASFGFMSVWFVIAVSHLKFRPAYLAGHTDLPAYHAPGFPYTSYIAAGGILAVLTGLWFIPEERIGIIGGSVTLVVISLYYVIARRSPAIRPPELAESLRLADFLGFEPGEQE